ncbi:GntR family transcriptional regulator [Novosphingobium sp. Gsoil 351]|uniref:GntR family transcriptional regulator n=1 Tax=Novosphingobium sp. Gsoil 351 TaxID=2675225 RepID=UPI0012B441E9|nr:GntR family transcriptional regulator [Novosphingobium sp. Gsoil 351]QGN55840.1 FCD domain-containing protein [Novosphingobium sp. Gsoil 351]
MNASDQAYLALREQILEGRLKPGTALKERDLCDELSVSRTPIREALRRLSADGLAEVRPGRSIIVSSFDAGELTEIFELGIVLESFVARLAAEKATDADIGRLEAIVAEMASLVEAGGAQEEVAYVKLDQAFHDTIAAMARNPRIAQILKQTMSFRVLANIFGAYEPGDFATSLAQHRTIVGAIASRDADWAQSAMGSHIRTGQAAHRRHAG